MKDFQNNFIGSEKNFTANEYIAISKEMAALNKLCFKKSKQYLDQETMFNHLKNFKNHVFFDRISLAIIQVSGLEADLITIMVGPAYQKRGVGRKLLNRLIVYLQKLEVRDLFLEVAKNNHAAIKIYNLLGFASCGTRKNYYPFLDDMGRDAELMVCNLYGKNRKFHKKKLQ